MNIGIFGVGSFGEKHINVLQTMNTFNIIGFFEPNKKRKDYIKNQYGIKSYENAIVLIKDCDAMDIVSSTESHFELIENGIQHNKHIFVEKPICWKTQEIATLLKMSKNYQSIIQVGHIERYNPTILKIIENKQINLLGGIKSIDAERIGALNKRNEKIPITLDIMIHDIDLILSIIKSEIKEVIVDHNNNMNNVSCEIVFQSGQNAHLKSQRDQTLQNNQRTMNIICEKGELKIDFLRKTIHMTQKDDKKVVEINTDKNINSLKEEFIDFQDSIRNKTQPLVGIQEGCQAVKLALNIENNIKAS